MVKSNRILKILLFMMAVCCIFISDERIALIPQSHGIIEENITIAPAEIKPVYPRKLFYIKMDHTAREYDYTQIPTSPFGDARIADPDLFIDVPLQPGDVIQVSVYATMRGTCLMEIEPDYFITGWPTNINGWTDDFDFIGNPSGISGNAHIYNSIPWVPVYMTCFRRIRTAGTYRFSIHYRNIDETNGGFANPHVSFKENRMIIAEVTKDVDIIRTTSARGH